jgi:hypothetical protein
MLMPCPRWGGFARRFRFNRLAGFGLHGSQNFLVGIGLFIFRFAGDDVRSL